MTDIEAPEGLRERGLAFWHSVLRTYELSTSEMPLLLEACRTLDNLDDLAKAVGEHGATVAGSMGQVVVNPAMTEARGQRLVLHRLLAALALPDEEGATVPTAGAARNKALAAARRLKAVS